MGGLLGGTSSKATKVVNQTVPEPEKVAEPTDVGLGRKQEDENLFGSSTPDLRVDRPSDAASNTTSGTGLQLM